MDKPSVPRFPPDYRPCAAGGWKPSAPTLPPRAYRSALNR